MHLRLRIEVKTELRVFKANCFAALAATAIDQEVDSLPSKNNGARAGIEPARCCHRGILRNLPPFLNKF